MRSPHKSMEGEEEEAPFTPLESARSQASRATRICTDNTDLLVPITSQPRLAAGRRHTGMSAARGSRLLRGRRCWTLRLAALRGDTSLCQGQGRCARRRRCHSTWPCARTAARWNVTSVMQACVKRSSGPTFGCSLPSIRTSTCTWLPLRMSSKWTDGTCMEGNLQLRGNHSLSVAQHETITSAVRCISTAKKAHKIPQKVREKPHLITLKLTTTNKRRAIRCIHCAVSKRSTPV